MLLSNNVQNLVPTTKQDNTSWQKEDLETTIENIGMGHKTAKQKKNTASEIGDFMRLFLQQLQCQDPLDPQDGAEFTAQLAQFNSVESLQKINTSMREMSEAFKSGRVLEATNLIGKEIDVKTNKMQLSSAIEQDGSYSTKVVNTTIHIPRLSPNDRIDGMQVLVKNAQNQEIIQTTKLQTPAQGTDVKFEWNGLDADGKRLQDGNKRDILDGLYLIQPQVMINGKWQDVETTVSSTVDSVSVPDSGKITLHASTLGAIAVDELKRVSGAKFDSSAGKRDVASEFLQQILTQGNQAAPEASEAPTV